MAVSDPVSELRGAVTDAAAALRANGPLDGAKLDRPPRADFGDYSTNAAMLLAPSLGEAPRAIAERLGEALGQRLGTAVERVEIAGPGFLNLFMTDAWYLDSLAAMRAAGERFGAGDTGERVQVEFVSANPTGPITVAAARGAAFGDSLARILAFAGNVVEREYYVNDAGTQVQKFGEAIRARARGEEPEEYRGDYVARLAERIPGAADGDADELAKRGIELMLEEIEATLQRFRVHMDRFFSERSLLESGAVEKALEQVEGVYESDGALWLRTTALGDDKDRVLRRSTGELAYFGADIAYHADKLSRGYDRLINVLGSDHHGYVKRIYAAWAALGGDPGRLRDRDDAAGPPVRGRQARADVEARGGDRHARRARGRHRGGRGALVPDVAQPRHLDRPRPRAGAHPGPGQPRVLRAVRARSDRVDPAQGGGGARGARRSPPTSPRATSASTRRRARWSSGCSSSRPRCRRRPSAARRTG